MFIVRVTKCPMKNFRHRVQPLFKLECVLTMVIWSEFRIGQYRDDDHWEDAPQFI